MQRVTIDNIVPGAVIAKPIYNEEGILLVPNGTILYEKAIRRLMDLNIHEALVLYPEIETSRILALYEETPHMDDIIYKRTRIQAQKLVKKTISKILPDQSIRIDKIREAVDEIIGQLLSVRDIILTLSRLRTIDDYTYEHSVNVCVVSLIIGIDLRLQQPDLKQLGTGALLHDVGKVCIPEEVLKKPSALTHEEYNEVKSHPEVGYKILLNSGVPDEVAQIALLHHEKYDGTGYNRGLHGEEIPLFCRIVTLADSYDAMSNDRIYRKKLPPDKVYKEIACLSGHHFDYDITERFLRRIDLFPIGTGVVLNTNHRGIVVSQNRLLPQSPTIRVFKGRSDSEDRKNSADYVDIDLARTKYLFIKETF